MGFGFSFTLHASCRGPTVPNTGFPVAVLFVHDAPSACPNPLPRPSAPRSACRHDSVLIPLLSEGFSEVLSKISFSPHPALPQHLAHLRLTAILSSPFWFVVQIFPKASLHHKFQNAGILSHLASCCFHSITQIFL